MSDLCRNLVDKLKAVGPRKNRSASEITGFRSKVDQNSRISWGFEDATPQFRVSLSHQWDRLSGSNGKRFFVMEDVASIRASVQTLFFEKVKDV